MRIFSGLTSEKQKKQNKNRISFNQSYHDECTTEKKKTRKKNFISIKSLILHYVDDKNPQHLILDTLFV